MMYVEIDVPDKKLLKILSDDKKIKKSYNKLYEKIKIRISFLQTSSNLNQIPVTPPERCHLLEGEYKGCYGININESWRLIIRPNGYDMPYNKEEITRISIIDIVNYHNK